MGDSNTTDYELVYGYFSFVFAITGLLSGFLDSVESKNLYIRD